MQLNPNAMDALEGFGHWIAGHCVGHHGDVRLLDMLSIFGLSMFRLYAELCSFRFLRSWRTRLLEFWTPGFWDFWILGFQDFCFFGFVDFRIFGFPDFGIFGFLDFWILGFLDFRILDFLIFLDSWLPRPIQFFATPIQKMFSGCGKLSGPSPSKKLPFSVLVRNLF